MSRNNASLLTGIINLAARLPWWAGIGLAVLSYFILGYVAGIQLKIPADLSKAGGVAGKQMLLTFAMIFQYILPIGFITGAFVSIVHSIRRKRLYGRLTDTPSLQTLTGMSWLEFELVIGRYFEQQGYQIQQLAQTGADGGVDLTVFKDNEKYLVQCKHWRSSKVGLPIVRELLGAITANGAVGGFVVTSGQFTQPAKEFTHGRNIELIDGQQIVNTVDIATTSHVQENAAAYTTEPAAEDHKPLCPTCDSAMVLRTAKKGVNAGRSFYGCSSYPKCRGTRSVY